MQASGYFGGVVVSGAPGAAGDAELGGVADDGGLSIGGVAGALLDVLELLDGFEALDGFVEVSPGRPGVGDVVALVLAAAPVLAPALGIDPALAC